MRHDGRLAVLGAGKRGQALIRGLVDAKVVRPDDLTVTAGHAERVAELSRTLGVPGAASNAEAVLRVTLDKVIVRATQRAKELLES
jgi:pyrroline-5-carboxylate reductase